MFAEALADYLWILRSSWPDPRLVWDDGMSCLLDSDCVIFFLTLYGTQIHITHPTVLANNVSSIDFRPNTPFSPAWLVAAVRNLMVPDRLWYRTDWVVTCWELSILMYWPGQLPGRSSVISGELQAGGIAYVYVWLECSYDSSEGQPGQLAYTFVIRILSTSYTYISTFSVCCYSKYLSRWFCPRNVETGATKCLGRLHGKNTSVWLKSVFLLKVNNYQTVKRHKVIIWLNHAPFYNG